MTIGTFDTNSEALAVRLELQHRLSRFDLNQWIFSHLPVDAGQSWLDLGCGRGEQTIPLARGVGLEGKVTSVDLSAESLAQVRRIAEQDGTADRIELIHANLDEISGALAGRTFDRAVGSYSLYYASDPEALFETVARSLAPSGKLFFCGPSYANNRELREMIAAARGEEESLAPTRPARFMEELAPAACRRLFAGVQVVTFENPVAFPSEDELIAYWHSHNLFDPAADERFRALAAGSFAGGQPFINTKRGIGILAEDPRAESSAAQTRP